ncbi:hypothetical protein AK830_g8648 [Neonectria ditissima]|uniref:Oxidoreductase-like domain-containing protein n=1 Tax=Neonectria ditissima TaxID=78410 RepID=A0A0P7ATX9_9HYPO|nr:hypothetical protein AK830_g8648 [Neonectria ditissima]
MSISARLAPRLRPLWSSPTKTRSFSASKTAAEEWPQRTPLGSYYETILNAPSPLKRPEALANSTNPDLSPPAAQPPAPLTKDKPKRYTSTAPAIPESTPQDRVRNIFGSRTLTPEEMAARMASKKSQSTLIAGVLVPPKPEEPDNCCMSGCVNCVWENFREEMEEWTLKNVEAQAALAKSAGSVDSDGGGSESNWVPVANVESDAKIAKDLWAKEIFDSVPVGIREFMKQEKRLKERHQKEGTLGS